MKLSKGHPRNSGISVLNKHLLFLLNGKGNTFYGYTKRTRVGTAITLPARCPALAQLDRVGHRAARRLILFFSACPDSLHFTLSFCGSRSFYHRIFLRAVLACQRPPDQRDGIPPPLAS